MSAQAKITLTCDGTPIEACIARFNLRHVSCLEGPCGGCLGRLDDAAVRGAARRPVRRGLLPKPSEEVMEGIPNTTTLGLHLLSEHRLANAHLLSPREQAEAHGHEHAGPGTIRNHPAGARNWSIVKVRETVGELAESPPQTPPQTPLVGILNHPGIRVVDPPPGYLAVIAGFLVSRTDSCTCDGPFEPEGAPAHREHCGWEPIVSLDELERLVPSVAARLVREFHEVFVLPIDDLSRSTNAFRAQLIREEAGEAIDAIECLDWSITNAGAMGYSPADVESVIEAGRAAVAKELADAVIALHGTAITMGIDLDEAVRLVHASNMSKRGADGSPIIRADGKVMKGPNYREPDMSSALRSLGSET